MGPRIERLDDISAWTDVEAEKFLGEHDNLPEILNRRGIDVRRGKYYDGGRESQFRLRTLQALSTAVHKLHMYKTPKLVRKASYFTEY